MKLVLAAILIAASTSFGAVIFTEDFDSSLAATVLNADVPGWTATDGTVDYLKSGFSGVNCLGNSGGCIDLDGSTGNAAVFTSDTAFNLLAGNSYTLTYYLSGSQRGGSDSLAVTFGGETNSHSNIAGNSPFTQYSIVVTPVADLTTELVFRHAGGDNIGVVLDGIVLDQTVPGSAVPEPSSMILLGGGLAGIAVLRRRG